jgi:hypothetical protein
MHPAADQSGLFTDDFLDFDSGPYAAPGTNVQDTLPDLPFSETNVQLPQYAYSSGQNVNPHTVAAKPDPQPRSTLVPRTQGVPQNRYATQQPHPGTFTEHNHDFAYAGQHGTSSANSRNHVAQQKSIPGSQQNAVPRSYNAQQRTGLPSFAVRQEDPHGPFTADQGASRSSFLKPSQNLGLKSLPGRGYKPIPVYSELQEVKARLQSSENR